MESLIAAVLSLLGIFFLVLPIWVIVKVLRHDREIETLRRDLVDARLESQRRPAAVPDLRAVPTPPPLPAAPAISAPPVIPPAPVPEAVPASRLNPVPAFLAEPPVPVAAAGATGTPAPVAPPIAATAANPPTPPSPPPPPPPPPEPGWIESINWEQFMGAKLFAWLGGLALFLGLGFFTKYSLDHGWIPPEVRVAIGFVFGAGLVVGGLRMNRGYPILAQTLVATGIVSLYAVTFACGEKGYGFLSATPAFLLMSLITAAGFILAVRLEAQVVAVLGIFGGFLTPPLMATGADNPVGLFGYIALLDVGLAAVALHRRWFYLVPLGAAGSVVMLVGWAGKFYTPEKTGTAMVACLAFCALFLGVIAAARRWARESPLLGYSALALLVAAFGFAWTFLGYPTVASRAGLCFGFVALVSGGAFALAWTERRGELVAGAATITALLLVRWTGMRITPQQAVVVVTVCLLFCALYLCVYLAARRVGRASAAVLWSAAGLPGVSLAFGLYLLDQPGVGAQAGLLFSFFLLADGFLLALAWLDERAPRLHLAAGLAVFALLSIWTAAHLTDELLPWALAVFLVFGAVHTVFPLLLERRRPAAAPGWWSQLFPPLALVLMLFPIMKLAAVSFLIWPAIFLVDVLAIGLAALSASLAALAAVLVLTLLATSLCLFHVPASVVFTPGLLLVVGGFALFFFAAGLWLVRRLGDRLGAVAGENGLAALLGGTRAQIPAAASLLPFLLLIMVCARLQVPDPSAVFGLALLLVVLTLGLTRLMLVEWLPACALVGVAALEYAWHTRHFVAAEAGGPLAWYLGFDAVFVVFPFLFRREFSRLTGPWAVAALSGVAHFWMVHRAIVAGWPNDFPGLVPALFAAAPLASLVAIVRNPPADPRARLNQLAWFGGVALFFITVVFPVQFEHQPQWLTVAWGLEGAALFWLFHRVPHPGLRVVGAALLVTAFARLALNPAVLSYHARSDTAIFNWYLYAYGLVTAALFAGAHFLPRRPGDDEKILNLVGAPLLNALGVVLAFILLNLEIADYFTPAGVRVLTLSFSGLFARDMTYTIAWALFALGLLGAGIWRQAPPARYASLGLLSVALLKLFFHDLARLEALYRIGALVGVAVIAFLASFAYQRFVPGNEKKSAPAP